MGGRNAPCGLGDAGDPEDLGDSDLGDPGDPSDVIQVIWVIQVDLGDRLGCSGSDDLGDPGMIWVIQLTWVVWIMHAWSRCSK